MATPGTRKQRHVLDIDDVVRSGFMTQANAEALVRGLNGSGGTVQLAVPLGGTNNGVFTDQELLKYDAVTGKIVSAGITGVLPGGQSVFVPRETETFYSSSGLDTTTTSTLEIVIAEQSFSLPANSQWSDLMVVFQTALPPGGSVTGLQVRLGGASPPGDVFPPTGFIQPSTSRIYGAGVSPDTSELTWIGMGHIPSGRASDSTMVVRLYGRPQDLASKRSIATRLSCRGVVPATPASGQKGVPVFFATPLTVFSGTTGTGSSYSTYNITAVVPDGASAVLVSAKVASSQQGGNIYHEIFVRADSGSYAHRLAVVRTHSDDDEDSIVNHVLMPFASAGGVRSFQYRVATNPNEGAEILLLGYIS